MTGPATKADVEREFPSPFRIPSMQPVGDSGIRILLESGFAVERDGAFFMRNTCAECKVEILLPTEREHVSLVAVRCLPRFCDSCIAKQVAAEDRRELERKMEDRVRESRLPAELRGLTFDSMVAHAGERQQAALQRARAWADHEGAKGLLLWGPAGTGKTRLAATACFARLERWPVRWVSVAILMAQLGAAFGDAGRREALKVLEGLGPLVLDDLDKVNPSEHGKAQLFAAIDGRVSAERPLLVTTNLPLDREAGYRGPTLAEKFGEAIVSRLAGHCRGAVYEMDGPDRRVSMADESSWAESGV